MTCTVGGRASRAVRNVSLTLREFQLGKFPLLALLAHLEYRDGIKLYKHWPWEGVLGGGCSSHRPCSRKLVVLYYGWQTRLNILYSTNLLTSSVFSLYTGTTETKNNSIWDIIYAQGRRARFEQVYSTSRITTAPRYLERSELAAPSSIY